LVNDIAEKIRDILVFHLGCEEDRLTDDAKLSADLGADSLDIVEILMSCEEKFGIDIPNHLAIGLVTVGDAVGCIKARVAGSAGPKPERQAPALAKSTTAYFGLRKIVGAWNASMTGIIEMVAPKQ
jgi:acyl carrier protein